MRFLFPTGRFCAINHNRGRTRSKQNCLQLQLNLHTYWCTFIIQCGSIIRTEMDKNESLEGNVFKRTAKPKP